MRLNSNQQPTEKTVDEYFDLLQSWQRRFVLQHLQRHPAPISVEELATELEDTAARGEVCIETAELHLRHVHLPKLAAAGLVTYDQATETVEPTASTTDPGGPIGHVDTAVDELRTGLYR